MFPRSFHHLLYGLIISPFSTQFSSLVVMVDYLLTLHSFTTSNDRSLHTLHYFSGCATAADVVLAVDSSGSITKPNFQRLLVFISEMVSDLDIDHARDTGTQVGAVTFANDVSLEFHLNSFSTKFEILNALDLMYTGGSTNTAAALRYNFYINHTTL